MLYPMAKPEDGEGRLTNARGTNGRRDHDQSQLQQRAGDLLAR
jgi:hypothetical protein